MRTNSTPIALMPRFRVSILDLLQTRTIPNKRRRHPRGLSGVPNGMQTRAHLRNGRPNPRTLVTMSSPSPFPKTGGSLPTVNR